MKESCPTRPSDVLIPAKVVRRDGPRSREWVLGVSWKGKAVSPWYHIPEKNEVLIQLQIKPSEIPLREKKFDVVLLIR